MKIKGQKPPKPQAQEMEFPRKGGNIVLTIEPVMDMFDKYKEVYPEPEPPVRLIPGGDPGGEQLFDDPGYKKKYDSWLRRNSAWLIYHSVKDTPGLEFESVNEKDPKTFDNIESEFKEFLSMGEYGLLAEKVNTVSLPNESSLKESIKVFALARQQGQVKSSQQGEQGGTLSGGLANDSE
jgi:hypothetical protein